MKAPPPLAAACPGKRRKLPRPTAEPATARITPSRVPHSCFCSAIRRPHAGKIRREQGTTDGEESGLPRQKSTTCRHFTKLHRPDKRGKGAPPSFGFVRPWRGPRPVEGQMDAQNEKPASAGRTLMRRRILYALLGTGALATLFAARPIAAAVQGGGG